MALNGKTALVTGGGRGIGEAIARHLAELGTKVVVCGRTETDIGRVAADIGGRAIVADLTNRHSTDTMLETLAREGSIDILVNNAGMAISAPLEKITDDDWNRVIALNLTAAFRLTRALVPLMVKRGWGRLVNIASNAGVSGYRYTAAYCASKHGLVGMTRALAIDLGLTGVTSNAVCPGWVATDMAEEAVTRIADKTGRSLREAKKVLASMSPQQRFIEPSEIAAVVGMLCSEGARGINGQAIVVDGGQVLK